MPVTVSVVEVEGLRRLWVKEVEFLLKEIVGRTSSRFWLGQRYLDGGRVDVCCPTIVLWRC